MKPLDLAAWAAALLLSSSLFAHTIALRLLLLLACLALVAAAIAKDGRSLRLLPPLWIPIVLWAAWAFASLGWTVEPAHTARDPVRCASAPAAKAAVSSCLTCTH